MINTTNNKSFILHLDSLVILEKLSDEQAGKIFKSIYNYQKNGKIDNLDFALDLAFTPFLNQFLRDEEKYKITCERNKQNILKRWEKNTSGKSGKRSNTKHTYSDSKNDSDSKNKNEKEKEKLPDFLDESLWNDFLQHRKKIKAPATEQAQKMILKDLEAFESKNIGSGSVALRNSIKNGWKAVFEPKPEKLGILSAKDEEEAKKRQQIREYYAKLENKEGDDNSI